MKQLICIIICAFLCSCSDIIRTDDNIIKTEKPDNSQNMKVIKNDFDLEQLKFNNNNDIKIDSCFRNNGNTDIRIMSVQWSCNRKVFMQFQTLPFVVKPQELFNLIFLITPYETGLYLIDIKIETSAGEYNMKIQFYSE